MDDEKNGGMILVISLASQHQLRRVFRGSVSFGQIVNSRVAVGWASWTELAKESWAACFSLQPTREGVLGDR